MYVFFTDWLENNGYFKLSKIRVPDFPPGCPPPTFRICFPFFTESDTNFDIFTRFIRKTEKEKMFSFYRIIYLCSHMYIKSKPTSRGNFW